MAAARYGILADAGVAYVVAEISWGLAFLGLYGWLFTNINVSLSSDFLHRDSLFWNRGGKVFFAAVLIGTYLLASIPATPAILAFFAA